ncbi:MULTISPECIES: hypothetical protein [Pseudomonas]|uniref:CopG family transcriptional regulator n=1 Tax=Pseudomonas luteola TaxID=47886 RepID=A0ABS0FPM5_PSELU|nr:MULTISPECIES: hypothetical protein [Pseudomonas]MBF8642294.1 hypothetical protein [Pseudomonas zeshuii]RRW48324.1 hypothetical protein EGJ50_10200 [Pseudomonas luteola]SHJ23854.1 hypothetical protein SAMN05216295_109200 [Pseudomonas zeshuii]
MYADSRHKHTNETKVRLDDEYEDALIAIAKIQKTQKAVLAREALKSWIDSMRDQFKTNNDVA